MKIGAFAKHFDINKTTVRYYTDIKLLIPDLTKTYPDYNKTCLIDMKDIMDYKKMGFSIEEIKDIKVLERFYVNLSESNSKHLQVLMEDKIKSHQQIIESHKTQIELIEQRKQSIDTKSVKQSFGLPLIALSFLCCSTCRQSFNIENANIKDNAIYDGRLICSCGTTYTIKNGIIFPVDHKPLLDGRNKQAESIEFLNKLNNNHISLINHAGYQLIQKLNEKDHSKGVIFSNADIDILMMNLDQTFQPEGIYFLCSYEEEALSLLKSKMERHQYKGHFVFIVFDGTVPLITNIPYLVDNVGNLYDCALKQDLGFGIRAFEEQTKGAEEWFFIQLFTPVNITSTESEPFRHYLNKTCYRDVFDELGMKASDIIQVGEFEFIEGMIKHINNVKLFHMEIIKYIKKS